MCLWFGQCSLFFQCCKCQTWCIRGSLLSSVCLFLYTDFLEMCSISLSFSPSLPLSLFHFLSHSLSLSFPLIPLHREAVWKQDMIITRGRVAVQKHFDICRFTDSGLVFVLLWPTGCTCFSLNFDLSHINFSSHNFSSLYCILSVVPKNMFEVEVIIWVISTNLTQGDLSVIALHWSISESESESDNIRIRIM